MSKLFSLSDWMYTHVLLVRRKLLSVCLLCLLCLFAYYAISLVNPTIFALHSTTLINHTILLFLLFILFIFLSEKKDIKQRERLWRVSSQWSWASKFHLTTPNRTCSLWRFCLLKSISLFIEKHIPSHGNSLAHRHDIGVILGFYWRDIGLLLAWYWAFGNTDRSVGFTQVSLPLSADSFRIRQRMHMGCLLHALRANKRSEQINAQSK